MKKFDISINVYNVQSNVENIKISMTFPEELWIFGNLKIAIKHCDCGPKFDNYAYNILFFVHS